MNKEVVIAHAWIPTDKLGYALLQIRECAQSISEPSPKDSSGNQTANFLWVEFTITADRLRSLRDKLKSTDIKITTLEEEDIIQTGKQAEKQFGDHIQRENKRQYVIFIGFALYIISALIILYSNYEQFACLLFAISFLVIGLGTTALIFYLERSERR